MSRTALQAYQQLQQRLLELGFVRPGSLVRRYVRCNKPSCACMKDPPKLHGPYYQWTHKIRGKTVTLQLTEAQARMCSEWVKNHQQLKKLVRQMEALSLKETDHLLSELGSTQRPRKAARSRKKPPK